MENNLHNIDKIFAKSLEDHSVDPPVYVWDNIQGKLDATNGHNNIDEIFSKSLGSLSVEPPAYVWDNIKGKLDATAGQNIDEIFSKTLGNHNIEAPVFVWDNIKAQLDNADNKRRKKIGWITGTASAVILSFIGGYFIANSNTNSSENTISKKISNIHQIQIDISHFSDLHSIVVSENTLGGQQYTSNNISSNNNDNTVNNNQNNFNNNENTNNGFDNRNTNNQNGFSETNTNQNFEDNRSTPNVIFNDEHNSNSPEEIQDHGGDEKRKKNNAVISDINGPVENQIGINGFINIVAINNNTEVIIDNSINENSNNNVIVSQDNSNTTINENRSEVVNPNDKSITENKYDEAPTTFTILPYFSMNYTWRNSSMISTNGIQDAFDTLNGNSKFSEKVNFSYSTGLLVGYNFTDNLTVFIGASYNTFSNTTSRSNIHSKAFDQAPGDTLPMLTTAGELSGVNVIQGTPGSPEDPTKLKQDDFIGTVNSVTQTFSYVEVPVMVRYKIGGPKVGLILTGGISTGFIVQNNVTLESANETKSFGQTNEIRNFNMNASFGIGVEIKLLPYMFLNLEPTFKYSFINWSMDNRFQVNPVSLGLHTGLAFKF